MKIKTLAVVIIVAMGVLLINFNIALGASESEVVINEFLPDPVETPESNYEFIELYNYGDTAVNITEWILEDEVTPHTYTIPEMTIEPGEFKIFWRNETDITLNNDAEGVWLND
ncbi:MAG: lamin tail domain-containing protein, partial [Methanophagales archaeon]|nr:lamin tail domain-containing protein [Methanophagales archaeon]